MHNNEIEINDCIVARLVNEQFPQFAGLPVQRFHSTGTANAIYRLGDEHCVRLPRLDSAEKSLNNEWLILPNISESVTLAVPQVVGIGKPNADYPLSWGIYRWIKGDAYDDSLVDETEAAEALARFIKELHNTKPSAGIPMAGRAPLLELDDITVNAIMECKEDIDSVKALEIWNELLDTEPWDGNPVLIHADLLKPNLIVSRGKLSAIIDFGSAGVGDPAFDVIPAWAVFSCKTREYFRGMLDIDDSAWRRAKAYALHQALLIVPYYRKSNPVFVEQAKITISNIIA